MYRTQPRLLPERIYEPNIIHNPTTWMGIWTPHGWRVNPKRWGQAERFSITLSGDGRTTFFPEALLDPQTGKVGWQDDLHLRDDPFSDGGIYPSDPRVEYPAGRPRWAVSHTLLCYPVADHNLYTHEYVWDMVHGHLQTHFHQHVPLEEARTDARDGRTVQVRHTPISRTIEGNVHYPMPNSAVRGVWANPRKQGPNLYTRRITQLIPMQNAVYAIAPHVPVVQCHGMWAVLPEDPLDEVFDADSGACRDTERLIEQFHIPIDAPKLAMMEMPTREVPSRVYEGSIHLLAEPVGTVSQAQLDRLRRRLALDTRRTLRVHGRRSRVARQGLGCRFVMGKVGFAGKQGPAPDDLLHCHGYCPSMDFNEDGVIDEQDEAFLASHLGRLVRYNLYFDAYFGGNWLTSSVCLEPEHRLGIPAIADYVYGAGYDGLAGVIRLFDTPGPDQPVWVEYHYDAPAEPGENNIRVHLFRERS